MTGLQYAYMKQYSIIILLHSCDW